MCVEIRLAAVWCAVALAGAGCAETIELDDAGPPAVEEDAGPGETDAGPPEEPDAGPALECTGDERLTRTIYYGTAVPSAVPLTPEQVLSVVSFGSCSGAFVTDEWVLTARHCGISPGREACVGVEPANPNVCFTIDSVENHPIEDITLAHVSTPASSRLPQLSPVPVMTEPLDGSWIGRIVEASGYGRQEDGSSGEREFSAETLVGLTDSMITIDGMGMNGVCSGDSGGPLFGIASDGTVRVIGELLGGDSSCVDRDNFTRTDAQIDWIEAIIGPVLIDGAPCGSVTEVGDCVGSTSASWCDPATGTITSERCEGGTACGWSNETGGFRCVTDDPCNGVSATGECQGSTAVWCDAGVVRERACGECQELCRFVSDVGGFYCRPDPCVGFPEDGECDGTIVTLCDPDEGIQSFDCARFGRTCGYSTRRGRNSCVRP